MTCARPRLYSEYHLSVIYNRSSYGEHLKLLCQDMTQKQHSILNTFALGQTYRITLYRTCPHARWPSQTTVCTLGTSRSFETCRIRTCCMSKLFNICKIRLADHAAHVVPFVA